MRRRLFGTVLALGVLVVAGCGDDETSTTAGGVSGRTFLSTEVSRDLVAGTRIRLEFIDGDVRATAGCNHLGGAATLNGDRLVVTNVGGTEMGCDPDRHAQDDWLADFLGRQPTWTLDGDTLTLADGTDTLVLVDRRVAEPDRPLEGTTWVVDGVITGDAVSSAPGDPDVQASITFEAGQVRGNSGCNTFSGLAGVSNDSIAIGDLASTLIGCEGERGDLEEAVYTVLQGGPLRFEIEASHLTLTTQAGTGLTLRAE